MPPERAATAVRRMGTIRLKLPAAFDLSPEDLVVDVGADDVRLYLRCFEDGDGKDRLLHRWTGDYVALRFRLGRTSAAYWLDLGERRLLEDETWDRIEIEAEALLARNADRLRRGLAKFMDEDLGRDWDEALRILVDDWRRPEPLHPVSLFRSLRDAVEAEVIRRLDLEDQYEEPDEYMLVG